MNNVIGYERPGSVLAGMALSDIDKQMQPQAGGQAVASTRDMSLDDVVTRLKSNAGADSRSEVLRTIGALAAPQLRKPATVNTPKEPTKSRDAGVLADRGPDGLEGAAALSYWVAKIQKVASDTSSQQLMDSMDRFKEQSSLQRKSFEKQAEAQQKKEDIAALASDIIGCAGKILGGVLVGVSVISAVFSGGSSLVLAGVGIALLAADSISEAATGETLTGKLISPLMDKIFAPLVSAIGGAISGVLQKFGVNEDVAIIVGAVLGAALAVMAVIAVAVAAKSSAASGVISKITGPLMKGVTKAIPKMLTSMTRAVSTGANAFTKSAGENATKLAAKVGMKAFNPKVFALQAQMVGLGGATLGGAGQAGGSAYLGVNAKDLSLIQAEILQVLNSMPQVERIMDAAVKHWQGKQSWATGLQKASADAMELDGQASLFTLRNARRVAI